MHTGWRVRGCGVRGDGQRAARAGQVGHGPHELPLPDLRLLRHPGTVLLVYCSPCGLGGLASFLAGVLREPSRIVLRG